MRVAVFLFAAIISVAVQGSPSDVGIKSRAKECTTSGLMCEDCKKLFFCYQASNGKWEKILIENCGPNKYCTISGSSGTCSENADGCGDGGDSLIKCYQKGTFPHPFDCTKFYTCIQNDSGDVISKPIFQSCETNFGYDPLTTICKNLLVNGRCPKSLVEPCVSSGKYTAIEANPHLYAICLIVNESNRATYYPHMFYCKNNEYFYKDKCVKPDYGLDNGYCTKKGTFYDPENCRRYIECVKGGKPTYVLCSTGQRFDPIELKCSTFKC